MDHLACFIVGLLALEALNENNLKRRSNTLRLAEKIANTCHESYIRTGNVLIYLRQTALKKCGSLWVMHQDWNFFSEVRIIIFHIS